MALPHTPIPDSQGIFVKAGWTGKLNSLGNTSFWGEYGRNWDGFSNLNTGADFLDGKIFGSQIVDGDAQRLGIGMVQEIDAAAMSFWAKYTLRDLDFDWRMAVGEADHLKMFLVGAVIFY